MGMIGTVLGRRRGGAAVGEAIRGIAEAFVSDAAHPAAWPAEPRTDAPLLPDEAPPPAAPGRFDRTVNGLNRLPRPMLAFLTLGLFVFAMVDPVSFAGRMAGLAAVPEPLWWLLGAIVAFYFGARETHYYRTRPSAAAAPGGQDMNPALDDWQGSP